MVIEGLQRALVRPVALLRLTSDRASYREYMRLRAYMGTVPSHAPAGREVELRLGRLNGRPVWVREGTGDVDKLWEVFVDSPHLPPARVQRRGMHVVWELGAGIGLAMTEMAVRWPEARIIGVERDPEAAALARRNFEPWDDRAELVEEEVRPDSLNDLLERTGGGPVAYVRMDIGGDEREVLTHGTEWAAEVGCIKVEVHGDYTTGDAVRDLERLGFKAQGDRRGERLVLGIR
jgi:hypothetical protein